MDLICRNISELKNEAAIERMEDKYNIEFPVSMVSFYEKNNGGTPRKKQFSMGNEEYEVRCFLSFNDEDYNAIRNPMKFFQENTNGKIVPLAKDSGDNYFCLNIETGRIYYWDKEDAQYYRIADTFDDFLEYLC